MSRKATVRPKDIEFGVLNLEMAARIASPLQGRASEFLAFIQKRIGRTPRERLEWVVRVVQRKPKDMTPGDWDNLRSELTGFAQGNSVRELGDGTLLWLRKDGELFRPSQEEAKEMLTRMGGMIESAVKRQRVTIGHVNATMVLHWCPRYHTDKGIDPRWMRGWDGIEPDWADDAAIALGDLIEKEGTLLRECPAPLPRDEEVCGVWFVAKRPKQEYCSATCQSRASTRAARAGTGTPAMQRRKAQKEG
jgi:hypothetical protein